MDYKKWLNIGINVILPVVILTRGNVMLGQVGALVLALLLPLVYGLFELYTHKVYNIFSIIGLVSILLTGGIGLLQLPNEWLAVKEALVPFVIGCAVLLSRYTSWPLVKVLLEPVIDHQKVDDALVRENNGHLYEQRLRTTTIIIGLSFFLSTALNYILATRIVVSTPGTEAYNMELGRLAALSYPAIALPTMLVFVGAVLYLVIGLERLTKLPLEQILKNK